MEKIPFSFLPPPTIKYATPYFQAPARKVEKLIPYLQLELDQANWKKTARQYLAECLAASAFNFVILALLFALFFSRINIFLGLALGIALSIIIFTQQLYFPKLKAYRRIKRLDTDLLASLRTMLIQINSGVSLFDALVTVGQQHFGEVSVEFKKVVESINGGTPQVQALEEMVLKNPSPYFQQALWQIINGMKAGSTINSVLSTVIDNITKEELIQIEKYGAQLNPLAMFYMIIAVIMPALSITFILAISSFIQLSEFTLKVTLGGLLVAVIFLQIMFMGMIKTKRPSLLGE